MSYEGYDIIYCKKGHYIDERDAYNPIESPWGNSTEPVATCPVCGELTMKDIVEDCVDQTNGCYCDELTDDEKAEGIKCPCHPTITKIIGYDPITCKSCKGSKETNVAFSYSDDTCTCNGDRACDKCFGTGVRRIIFSELAVQCPTCSGTGIQYIPFFDLSPLAYKLDNVIIRD